MDERAIGIFDSGLGGLTAARVIRALMPGEHIIYFGDSGRMPYGSRSKEEIASMSCEIAEFLMSMNVKAMLVACGTITTNALDELRSRFPVPFFGVVDAACTAALRASSNGRVGVIATEASIRSGAYEKKLCSMSPDVRVTSLACPPFAAMVESGHFSRGDETAEKTVAEVLEPLKGTDIDTLLLGCTHYPLLSDIIGDCLGDDVQLISAGAEAASALEKYLRKNSMLAAPSASGGEEYYTSGDLDAFAKSAALFLGREIKPQLHVL